MAQKTDAELVIDDLVAVGDYTRKASEAAGRLVECCERQEEAWRSGAPEHAQAIAAREVAAATDEALRLGVNARQYRSRCDAGLRTPGDDWPGHGGRARGDSVKGGWKSTSTR